METTTLYKYDFGKTDNLFVNKTQKVSYKFIRIKANNPCFLCDLNKSDECPFDSECYAEGVYPKCKKECGFWKKRE